ncbi:sensor histidine kinase [Pseudonocardia asaccharolytica]|uniref:histidine kinase n=1 Tax=Pseudonocardia asaccharolytica DSM 44247 = NBRC 16224 TaxID=1123024 RepID=A0A511D2T7_9PSEU|nr:HAMP domain-containing sensor histidine kinase [Pseudonocardia asaccharolytica]GEL18997.1 two-component sensor histidine kinase [Pseudonocardia asaccharolytica DSM 44247 = NBRC 16224]
MRARLLVIVLVLVGLLAVGLGVPLAMADARGAQQELFTDRLTDTIFFASIAQRPITEANATGLAAELARYDEVYGVTVAVLDREQRIVAASRAEPIVLDEVGRERVRVALANRRSEPYPFILPWDDQPLVLAEPVLVDGEVRGAALTISPTEALRAQELRVWSMVAGAILLALVLGVLVALPVVRWILLPVRRLDEGTGRIAGAVLAGKEVEPIATCSGPPELRRLSASFDRMAGIVTQALAAQRAFVADASHQLRNPLTALRLRLSNLDGHVDAAAAEHHAAALEEAERLSAVLDGLLALARAERVSETGPVELDPSIEDRIEAWRPLAEHIGLKLTHCGMRGLRARATHGGIETLLDALLDNAMKFTPSGGVVMIGVRKVPGGVDLVVRDTGPGMAPEELERATDRFWRGPGQSNVEGSGLGLAIAARTVELSGGTLRLELPRASGLRVVARLLDPAPP